MSQDARTTGLLGYSGMKIPVRAATTAAITLSGEQTIDGVACVTGDRVLVKDQASGAANGIYVVDTGSWELAKDADGSYDYVSGTLVPVSAGTVSARAVYMLTTTGTITPGTTSLTFAAMGLFATPVPIASGGTGSTTANAALTALTATRAETGGAAIPALTILRRTTYPEDFGAVGDGSTDDKTALTNWINAIIADSSFVGRMQNKVYATSGALPNITASGVHIYGTGPSTSHDVGTTYNGTTIKAITNSGFTILTVAPTEGASAQRLDSVVLDGIGFLGNSLAAKNLLIKGVRRGVFNVYTEEATTSGVELDVSTTLGESTDTQQNIFNIDGRQVLNNAPSLRLKGSATANVSFNDFQNVTIVHKDELGIISENADNNRWGTVRVFRAAGGSATNSVEWRGGSSAAVATRDEYINLLSTTVAAIAKGTGTYTVGATNIRVENLDYTNSTPTPTVETGTSVWVHGQRSGTWTPALTFATPGNQSIAYTTQIGRYVRTGRLVAAEFVVVTSTFTHTTAAGNLSITGLPFTSSTVSSMEWRGTVSWQGITKANYTEVVPSVGSASSDIQFSASGSAQSRSSIAFGDVPTGGTVILSGTVVYETDAAP